MSKSIVDVGIVVVPWSVLSLRGQAVRDGSQREYHDGCDRHENGENRIAIPPGRRFFGRGANQDMGRVAVG
mgnify:CR=1 FL=1